MMNKKTKEIMHEIIDILHTYNKRIWSNEKCIIIQGVSIIFLGLALIGHLVLG